MSRSPLPCPQQNRDYSETFHLIDKGNAIKAKYDLGVKSLKHKWCPKLFMRLLNMDLNNAYQI